MNNEAQPSTEISPVKFSLKDKNKSGEDIYDTKKEPRKAMGVYLKNQNRFFMNSIAIADKKAAILI